MAIMLLGDLYDRWRYQDPLNRQILSSVEKNLDLIPDAEDVLKLAGHLIGSMRRWMGVLGCPNYREHVANSWPQIKPEQLVFQYGQVWTAWFYLLGRLNDSDLDKVVSFTGNDGQPKRCRLRDIIQHLLDHSQGHRAQLVKALKPVDPNLHTDHIRQMVGVERIGEDWNPRLIWP